jgi:transcription elongation GreA/GreB family factor
LKDQKELKKKLKLFCGNYLEEMVATTKEAIRQTQLSANEETKNSSGDKYETGRSMAQLEIEKLTTQLENTKRLIDQIQKLDPTREYQKIQFGCLVKTIEANYFISVPVGKIQMLGEVFYAISVESPLAKAMLGLSICSFKFNQKEIAILEIV